MTGMEALVSSHISASHVLHSGSCGAADSAKSPEDVGRSGVGFGRSAEVSVGGGPAGVTVSEEEEEEPLGISSFWCQACSVSNSSAGCDPWTRAGVGVTFFSSRSGQTGDSNAQIATPRRHQRQQKLSRSSV